MQIIDYFKSFAQMSNNQKRNLVIAGAIIILGVVGYFYLQDNARSMAKKTKSSKDVSGLSRRIEGNRDVYDMLVSAKVDFKVRDILAGAKPDYFRGYFSYIAPKAENTEGAKVETAAVEAEPSKPYVWPNDLTFIYTSEQTSYVIIDGKLLSVGGKTPSGMIVRKIENTRVLLEGKWSKKWVTLKF